MTRRVEQMGDTEGPPRAAAEGATEHESSDAVPRRSLLFHIQKFGYRKFPSVIPDPERQERLEQWRRNDAEDNAKSEPSSNEVIDSLCIWAVEFYTPSQTSELLRGFEKLGWNTEGLSGGYHNPALWIQRNRESSHGGGWFNLGTIRRPSEEMSFRHDRPAPLPSGVEYALASMYSLTSSITCIVIAFVLDETQNRRFEQALRRKRQTYTTPLRGSGYRIVKPASQKEADIRALRAEMREFAAGWFRSHLPGLFASGNLMGEYPTCEFLTLRDALPSPPCSTRDHTKDKWLRILDIDNDFHAWEAEELSGLKFVWPLTSESDNRYHAVMVAREEDFSDETLRLDGGKDRHSLVFYVDQFVNEFLSRWALVGMLSGYERYLNSMRDSAAFDPKHRAKPFQLLEGLGSHFAQSIDISAVSVELQQFAERHWLFKHNVNVFYPCNPALYRDDKIELSETLRQHTTERAEWIRNIDQSIRDILIQYGTTLGTRENIKLQARMGFLTWVIVVLTIMTVILTTVTTVTSIKVGNLSWPW